MLGGHGDSAFASRQRQEAVIHENLHGTAGRYETVNLVAERLKHKPKTIDFVVERNDGKVVRIVEAGGKFFDETVAGTHNGSANVDDLPNVSADALSFADSFLAQTENFLGIAVERFAGFGEDYTAIGALKKFCADKSFEGVNLIHDGNL